MLDVDTIPGLLLRAAKRFSTKSGLEDGDLRWSFAELADAALEAAAGFIAAGVEPGDRVAIWAPNGSRWILAALGLQAAGAALVPLNTRFKGSEAGYILRKSGARMLVCVPEFLGNQYLDMLEAEDLPDLRDQLLLDGSDPRARTWDEFTNAGRSVSPAEAQRRAESVGPDDLADILFTSGTTGHPKGVMMTHGQNLIGYEAWTDAVGLREGDRYLIVNPFFHAFGYKAGWMSCLMRGATILPHAQLDVPEVLARVPRDRVTVLPGPPAIYQTILMHPDLAQYDLSSLRLAMTGAAVIPPELIRRMKSEIGFDTVVTGYGLTETAGLATQNRAGEDAETIALTSGPALPFCEVRCVSPEGADVPVDEDGEILLRGATVTRGYFDDEGATRNTIDADGWLHTGDVGRLDARGYIRITDRLKDMYIMGGFNCYPAEIEKLLFEMPGIGEVAVIGVPDERMGEVGRAFVVAESDAAITPDDVIAWSRANMANYKVPRSVEIIDELPKTASGKVQKFVLRRST